MTPNRPYLLRALNDWILDNYMTPHLLVDAEREGVIVPEQFVEKGKIILNLSPVAVKALQISNDLVSFNARFSGKPYHICVPPDAVLAIYAKENGMGMIFTEESADDSKSLQEGPTTKVEPSVSEKKNHLRIIK